MPRNSFARHFCVGSKIYGNQKEGMCEMVNPVLEKELHQQLEHLAVGQQRQVLDFARALASARTRGVPGQELLRFAGTIEPNDLQAISQAITEDCEKINE